jgi:hypothetical protein
MTKWKEGSQYNGWTLKKELDRYVSPKGLTFRRFLVACDECGYNKETTLSSNKARHICYPKNKPSKIKVNLGDKVNKVTIRFSDENKKVLKEMSIKENCTISVLIRNVLNKYVDEHR